MAIFSPKARQLIDTAFADLGGTPQKDIWQAWVRHNNEVRSPAGPTWESAEGRLPFEIAMAAVYALEHLRGRKERLRDSGKVTSEDELSDLDNDISHVKSVERFLVQAAAAEMRSAAG
jgi:hypothetical protein